MTARSLHEIASGKAAKGHRTGQPVRRNSKAVGSFEHRYWTRFDPKERNARMRAAEMHARSTKEAGKRNGALGHVALELLRELMRMVDFKTGRLDPAINTLRERINRSRSAVIDALAELQAEGFLGQARETHPLCAPRAARPHHCRTRCAGRRRSEAVSILMASIWQKVRYRWRAAGPVSYALMT